MSMFKVSIGVGHPDGGDLSPVHPTVDTGAAHSMLPESLMIQLSIEPEQQLGFILDDGSRVRYGYGMARFSNGDYQRACPVIFGPEGNYLLGASTLEVFNLVVDPAGEQLLPAEWLSLGWGG